MPQVEAISPTLPSEDGRPDLSPQRTSKDELLNAINKLDREIAQVESQTTKLKKKQVRGGSLIPLLFVEVAQHRNLARTLLARVSVDCSVARPR